MRWLYGVIGGGIAAIVASLVSLPLDSPDDVIFNTATVAIAAIAVGVFEGVLWQLLAPRPQGRQLYAGISLGAFVVAALACFAFELALDGAARFALPLAALLMDSVAKTALAGKTLDEA